MNNEESRPPFMDDRLKLLSLAKVSDTFDDGNATSRLPRIHRHSREKKSSSVVFFTEVSTRPSSSIQALRRHSAVFRSLVFAFALHLLDALVHARARFAIEAEDAWDFEKIGRRPGCR